MQAGFIGPAEEFINSLFVSVESKIYPLTHLQDVNFLHRGEYFTIEKVKIHW